MRLLALRNEAHPGWVLALLVLALYLVGERVWQAFAPADRPPVGAYVPAMPAPAVARVETVATPIRSGTVRTLAPAAKARLELPVAIQAAPEKQVIAASTVPPDNHAYTLTTLIDTETGEVQTLQRREPLPWLGRDASGRLDMTLAQTDEGPVARLSATQNLLRVKAWSLGVSGAVTQHLGGRTDTDWLVGINLGTSW